MRKHRSSRATKSPCGPPGGDISSPPLGAERLGEVGEAQHTPSVMTLFRYAIVHSDIVTSVRHCAFDPHLTLPPPDQVGGRAPPPAAERGFGLAEPDPVIARLRPPGWRAPCNGDRGLPRRP